MALSALRTGDQHSLYDLSLAILQLHDRLELLSNGRIVGQFVFHKAQRIEHRHPTVEHLIVVLLRRNGLLNAADQFGQALVTSALVAEDHMLYDRLDRPDARFSTMKTDDRMTAFVAFGWTGNRIKDQKEEKLQFRRKARCFITSS